MIDAESPCWMGHSIDELHAVCSTKWIMLVIQFHVNCGQSTHVPDVKELERRGRGGYYGNSLGRQGRSNAACAQVPP